jgi:hypothetical protein
MRWSVVVPLMAVDLLSIWTSEALDVEDSGE